MRRQSQFTINDHQNIVQIITEFDSLADFEKPENLIKFCKKLSDSTSRAKDYDCKLQSVMETFGCLYQNKTLSLTLKLLKIKILLKIRIQLKMNKKKLYNYIIDFRKKN